MVVGLQSPNKRQQRTMANIAEQKKSLDGISTPTSVTGDGKEEEAWWKVQLHCDPALTEEPVCGRLVTAVSRSCPPRPPSTSAAAARGAERLSG